jgi:hypothetical protein
MRLSSNGRTADSKPANVGSIPTRRANCCGDRVANVSDCKPDVRRFNSDPQLHFLLQRAVTVMDWLFLNRQASWSVEEQA